MTSPYPKSPTSVSIKTRYTEYTQTKFNDTASNRGKQTKTRPNKKFSQNKSTGSLRSIGGYNVLPQRNLVEGKNMRQSFNFGPSIQRKLLNQSNSVLMQKNSVKLKQNHDWSFQLTFQSKQDQNIQHHKTQKPKQQSIYHSKIIAADNFQSSFHLVLSCYIELYYQKMTYALHLKEKPAMLFKHLLQFVEYQKIDSQAKLSIDQLSVAIHRIVSSKNIDYKMAYIKYGLLKIMKGMVIVDARKFAALLQTHENESYLSNPAKNVISNQFQQIVKGFFQIFVRFYDTEVKLKKICMANPKKMMRLIVEMSVNSELNLKMMAESLYLNEKKSKNWLMLRFEQFIKQKFGRKDTSIQFLSWIKQLDY